MSFGYLIIKWYEEHKRDLPWRHTNDPYRIWVSEIILQQTRVEQGLAYYQRFVERFPDVGSLAGADEEEVMKVWQGLGYYSRARNMHHSAKTIVGENRSVFPASYEKLRKIRGVGDYSASAIASIAYGEPQPVVDGNVLRVVARFEGIKEPVNTTAAKKKVKEILTRYIDPLQPGIFNQAVMELGALICKPRQPLCPQCPVMDLCYSYHNEAYADLPIINKPKATTLRFFYYLIILSRQEKENFIWLKKRAGDDIWKNLYDFPLIETEKEVSTEALEMDRQWDEISGLHRLKAGNVMDTVRYMLTHRELRVKFILIPSDDYSHPGFLKVNIKDIHKYPVPRLIENFIKKVTSRPGIFSIFPD